MVQITFITVGALKENYLKDAVSEYKKRLLQYARVDEVNIKEELIKNEDDKSEIERALLSEGEKILSSVPKDAKIVSLCVEGQSMDSVALAKRLGEFGDECGKIAFIIGSSHGLSPTVKSKSDLKLSVSKLTFPHQLMRPLLYEIVYRSYTILAGKRYHK